MVVSVEEMHVAVQDECEKSNGENESNVVVDKLTTEVVEKAAPGSDSDLVIKNLATEVVEKAVPGNDSDILANLATEVVKKDASGNDSDIFAGLNGVKTAVEAVTAAGESQQNIASVIKEQEKEDKVDQKKEQPVSGDAGDAAKAGSETPQEPATVVANGVSCDVNDDIEEEDIVDEDDVVDELSPSSQFTDAKEEQSPVTQPSSVSEVESKEPASVAEVLQKDSLTEAVVSNEAKSPATIEQNGTPANEIAEKMETDVEEVAEQKSPVSEEESAAAVVGDDDKMETEETKSETSPETIPVPVPVPVASATAELSPSPAAAVEKAPESVTVPKDSSLEKKPHLPVIVRDKPCAVVAATNFGVAENIDDKMDTTDAEPVIKINDDQNAKPTLVDEFKPAVDIKPVESAVKDVTPETTIKPVEDPVPIRVPVPVPERKIEKKPAEPEKEPAAKETATVASVKRKATADTAEEPEQDRDGGISSSSSHSSSSEADNTQDCKRIRFDESIFEEDERERLIREFVDRSTETSDEIGKNCDKLQHEIAALSDLARAKELEWNSIMRLLKLKEEMLERILFKKRHIDCQNKPEMEVNVNKMYKNFVTSSTTSTDQKSNRSETSTPTNINNHVSVVPIGSSISAASAAAAAAASASATSGNASSNLSNAATAPQDLYNSGSGKSSSAINSSLATESLGGKLRPQHRPILPKPPVTSASQAAAAQSSSHVSHTLHAAVQQAAAAAAAQQAMAQPPHSSSSSQQQHMQHQHQAQSNMMQSNAASLLVDQNSIIGEGRQGPILDVKSIIADFRSKNPDSLPRRGRRNLPFGARGIPDNGPGPRFLGNTSLLSMANIALGSGSHIRTSVTSTTHNDHRPNSFMMGQDNSVPTSLTRTEMQMRHPTIDSLMLSVNQAAAASGNSSQPNSSTNSSGNSNSNNDYFRETLVKIAKLNEKRSEMSNAAALHMGGNNKGGGGSHLPPPPPYPEVTLHPVLVPQSSGSPPVQNSLLHGILTKSNAAAAAAAAQAANNQHHPSSTVGSAGSMGATSVSSIQHRPTTFSPTLARLLTAPERSRGHRTTIGSSGRNTKSTLNEILNSKKTRTEVTITPVTTSTAGPTKNGSDVVLDDDDESEVADRLVIDEGREVVAESASNVIPADQVPECQGCHKKAAQFVCAGCGNQWYCSRECQVEAWENHSEMCSG